MGFHQPNQTAETLAVFLGEVAEREETHAMFDYPALAFNQESPDAARAVAQTGQARIAVKPGSTDQAWHIG